MWPVPSKANKAREFDLMTANNKSRQDHGGKSMDVVDKENDVENQVVMTMGAETFIAWPKFCEREVSIVDIVLDRQPICQRCYLEGKIMCAPRWRR